MYLQSIVSGNLIIYFFHNIKKLFVSYNISFKTIIKILYALFEIGYMYIPCISLDFVFKCTAKNKETLIIKFCIIIF